MKDKLDTTDDYEHPAEQCDDCEHAGRSHVRSGLVCHEKGDSQCESINAKNNCEDFKFWEGPKTVRRDKA